MEDSYEVRECDGCGVKFECHTESSANLCDECEREAEGFERSAREAWATRDHNVFAAARDGLD